jgi:hypothetical protein
MAAIAAVTQVLRQIPFLSSGTAGRIIAALGALAAALGAHGATFGDPGFYIDALLTFLGSAGIYHTVSALPAGGGSASVSLKLLVLAVGLSATACVTVPVADSPLACAPASPGVCASGQGEVCQGTVTDAGQTRHVAITYCESLIPQSVLVPGQEPDTYRRHERGHPYSSATLTRVRAMQLRGEFPRVYVQRAAFRAMKPHRDRLELRD